MLDNGLEEAAEEVVLEALGRGEGWAVELFYPEEEEWEDWE